jgi:hypothetical protein
MEPTSDGNGRGTGHFDDDANGDASRPNPYADRDQHANRRALANRPPQPHADTDA